MLKRSCQQSKSMILDLLQGCYSIEKIAKRFLADKCQNAFEQFIL